MLPLPPFRHHAPSSVDEVVALLSAHRGRAKLIAGGTDLLPNMKHRLEEPEHVVSLRRVPGLDGVREEKGELKLGPMVNLATVAAHPLVRARAPILARAASLVAGPQLREMATLGGNVCLDTRCVYFNQSFFWRKALGFCLKKDGTECHVVKGGKKCVAAASSDTVPALLALGASVSVRGPKGERSVDVEAVYSTNGSRNLSLEPDEVLTQVRIPLSSGKVVQGYEKLRLRASVDYPLLGLAAVVAVSGSGAIDSARVAVTGLGAKPHLVKGASALAGRSLDADTVALLGKAAAKECTPLENLGIDPVWRREMIPILLRRALGAGVPQEP